MRVCVLLTLLVALHSVCAVNYRKKIWKSLVPGALTEETDNENDKEYWNNKASKDIIHRITAHRENWNIAKNVIIFLGDGMGVSTLTAARIYKGQTRSEKGLNNPHAEGEKLNFEKFPHLGLSSTYNINKMTTDSAGSGSAYMTGVKARQGLISMDGHVERGNVSMCNATEHFTSSLHQWAVDSGKSAGVITTTRVTHATPAVTYAHTPDRDWESMGDLPHDANEAGCLDIATQLIREQPGRSFKVIMGGGKEKFVPTAEMEDDDGEIEELDGYHPDEKISDSEGGHRGTHSNLVEEWKEDKADYVHRYVENLTALNDIPDDTEYLFGLFSSSHMPFNYTLGEENPDVPSLSKMTEKAIAVLKNSHDDDGFVLMVEGGRIDHAHHDNQAQVSLEETLEFERAVQKAIEMTDEDNTLIVVTADHSHVFTVNGYPSRQTSITGAGDGGGGDDDHADKDVDGLVYAAVGYTNGPGFRYKVLENEDNYVKRYDLEKGEVDPVNEGMNITDMEFHYESGVRTFSETHGGEDVAIYARGPMAHLFHTNHEQSYIAHVMGYAACVGTDEGHYDNDDCKSREGTRAHAASLYALNSLLVCTLMIYHFLF